MKIAVVGCGAVGSYYGARLAAAGAQLHFLLRSDYAHVRRHGVWIRSATGDLRLRPKCARNPEEIGPVDLVLIGLKTTANDRFAQLLPPLVGPHTALLTLQNGLGNEEALAALFPSEQILGGLCFVCLNRVAPGVIQHIDHGRIVIGEFGRWPEPRTHEIAALFRQGGIPCEVSDNLARAHWAKLVWNIPFNGLGVASAAGYDTVATGNLEEARAGHPCLTTDLLLADARWENLVRELMTEIVRVTHAIGLPLGNDAMSKNIDRTKTMGPYRPSTVLDFEAGRPLELNALFQRPLDQARQAKVPVPRLVALTRVLEWLDQTRRLAADQDSNQETEG